MRVFLAGASGVIGRRLVPLLVAHGHEVAGMTRSPDRAASIGAMGASPVVCDVYDVDQLCRVVVDFAPDVVLHQLTDLPDALADISGSANATMRRVGTKNLLDAADEAEVREFIAQSVAWRLPGDGAAAVDEHESMVLAWGGVVVRYGQFHGPGTYHEAEPPDPPRVHVDTAAARTLDALGAPSGVITVVDD